MAAVLTLLFATVIGALLGVVLVLAGATGGLTGLWWLALLIPAGFAALHPRVVTVVVNTLLRVARRAPIDLQLTGAARRGSLGWPVVTLVCLGLQC